MAALAACEDRCVVKTTGSVSLLVKQTGSAAAEALHQGLRAAGLRVIVVPTAYDAAAEADRVADIIRYLIVGVDYFGPGEFRLMPLVRREWPEILIVAYHSPGFEYKGRVAELVGADVILATPEDVLRFVESLVPSVAPPSGNRAPVPPRPPLPPLVRPTPRRPEPRVEVPPSPPHVSVPEPAPTDAASAETAAASVRQPPAAPAAAPSPPTQVRQYLATTSNQEAAPETEAQPQTEAQEPADGIDNLDGDEELTQGNVLGTIELTAEELGILLGEDEET